MQTDQAWTWANLSHEQLDWLAEAEQTLGTDVLIAYETGGQAVKPQELFLKGSLQVANLNESQIECLQGLEKKLQSVVVAYANAD
jgi:hypothetical protein